MGGCHSEGAAEEGFSGNGGRHRQDAAGNRQGGHRPEKKDAWLAFGIVLCIILANEVDGMEWRTLIDGNREAPVLLNTATGEWIDPMKLVWSKVKAGAKVELAETYDALF